MQAEQAAREAKAAELAETEEKVEILAGADQREADVWTDARLDMSTDARPLCGHRCEADTWIDARPACG